MSSSWDHSRPVSPCFIEPAGLLYVYFSLSVCSVKKVHVIVHELSETYHLNTDTDKSINQHLLVELCHWFSNYVEPEGRTYSFQKNIPIFVCFDDCGGECCLTHSKHGFPFSCHCSVGLRCSKWEHHMGHPQLLLDSTRLCGWTFESD